MINLRARLRQPASGRAGATVVVLAAVAVLTVCAEPSLARTTGRRTARAGLVARDLSAPCVLVPGGRTSCESTAPTLSLDFLNETDTSGCVFTVTIDWGDASVPDQVIESGGPSGPTYLASHQYTTAGRYTIRTTGRVRSGGCTIAGASYSFTLLRPHSAPTASPRLGRDVVLTRQSGTISYRLPHSPGFAALTDVPVVVPNGTDVDALSGVVEVTVAGNGSGATESALAYAGYFIVRQQNTGSYATIFTLSEPLAGCAGPGAHEADGSRVTPRGAVGKPTHRRLWVKESGGSWGTSGSYVSTSVIGTQWLTLDGCTSSSVDVAQGIVAVHDLINRQTVIVRAHHRYSASTHERGAGPVADINSYWSAIYAHNFATAYSYVVPGVIGSEAAFIASETSMGIESVAFSGRVTALSGVKATVAVVSLVTRDHRYGCRTWSGSYSMTDGTGRWLVAKAAIKPAPCR